MEQVPILLSAVCKHPRQAKILLGFSFVGNVNPNKTVFTVNFLSRLNFSQDCSWWHFCASLTLLSFIWLQLVNLICRSEPAIISFLFAGSSIWAECSSACTSRLSELLPSYNSPQMYTNNSSKFTFCYIIYTNRCQGKNTLDCLLKTGADFSLGAYSPNEKHVRGEEDVFKATASGMSGFENKDMLFCILKEFHKIHMYLGKQKIFLYVCENWPVAGARDWS